MNCDFWHDLHDLKLVVKLILNRPRTYLDSRKHDDTVNHYQLTSFVQYTIYHQCCETTETSFWPYISCNENEGTS